MQFTLIFRSYFDNIKSIDHERLVKTTLWSLSLKEIDLIDNLPGIILEFEFWSDKNLDWLVKVQELRQESEVVRYDETPSWVVAAIVLAGIDYLDELMFLS